MAAVQMAVEVAAAIPMARVRRQDFALTQQESLK